MLHMMVLANVEGICTVFAVVGMVADRLHVELLALINHDVCVGGVVAIPCLAGRYRDKEDFSCRLAISCTKLR